MTQTLAVDSSNDLYLDAAGSIVIVRDVDAVMQVCQQVAQTTLGEMVLQADAGIPYFETVWTGVPNIPQFTAALRSAWLQVPDVIEITSLITSQEDNILRYAAVIRTSFGTGSIASNG